MRRLSAAKTVLELVRQGVGAALDEVHVEAERHRGGDIHRVTGEVSPRVDRRPPRGRDAPSLREAGG